MTATEVWAGWCWRPMRMRLTRARPWERRGKVGWICGNCADGLDCLIHLTGRFSHTPEHDAPGVPHSGPNLAPQNGLM